MTCQSAPVAASSGQSGSSPDASEFINDVARLSALWNDTEGWAKKGEFICEEVVMPAINELRYAGRKIVDSFVAFQQSDKQTAQSCLNAAADNLLKAKHDVVDVIVVFLSEKAGNLRDEIGAAEAQKFPKYGELFGLIKETQSQIAHSRENREQRDEIYDAILRNETISRLEALVGEFSVCIPAIQEAREKEELEKRKNLFLTIGIAAIGWIFAAMGWAFWLTR